MSPESQEKGKIELKMYDTLLWLKMFTGTRLPPNSDMWPSGINAEESGSSPVHKKPQRQAPGTEQEYQNTLDLHYFPSEFYTLSIWFSDAAFPYKCHKC